MRSKRKTGEGRAKCRLCGDPVIWVRMEASGCLVPLDAEPVAEGGNIVLVGELLAKTLGGGLFDEMHDGPRYQSHFATCPNAETHRKPTPRKRGEG